MNTGQYHKPQEILFMASAMAGDRDYKVLPRGFYMALIQEAFRELNLSTFFSEKRFDFVFPTDTLTAALPEDCFNIENIYMFNGNTCDIENSRKVYWKRNYFTKGNGFIANDKGMNNLNDPFLSNRILANSTGSSDKSLIRYNDQTRVANVLYYNVQMGNLMLSSSCRGAGNKVHLHYRSTGGNVTDAPIIPVFFKTAMEDYVTEAALRFRMANEPLNARTWQALQQMYERRLDKEGMNGSWHRANMSVKRLNKSQLEELKTYLGRAAWASGR
jgi:hypothetical protein